MMRKLKTIATLALLSMVLFYLMACSFASEPLHGYTMAEEQGQLTDLRDKPGEAEVVLFSYYPDVRVELLGSAADGWVHVRVCNIDGYMKVDQVSFDPGYKKVSHALPVALIKGRTNSGSVNFRELPTVDVPPLGSYFVGKEVHVMGISEEWCHINIDGRMGFMKAENLRDAGEESEYVIGSFQSPMRDPTN